MNGRILPSSGFTLGRICVQPANQACFDIFTELALRPIQSLICVVRCYVDVFVCLSPQSGPRTGWTGQGLQK